MNSLFAKIFNFIRNTKANFHKWLEETEEKIYPDDFFRIARKCHICSVPEFKVIPWDCINNMPSLFTDSMFPISYIKVDVEELKPCNICHELTCHHCLNQDGICLDCLKSQKETR